MILAVHADHSQIQKVSSWYYSPRCSFEEIDLNCLNSGKYGKMLNYVKKLGR